VIEDPHVDIVHVDSTHPCHRQQALMAIEAGKPVLIGN
jgi:predicted dehydrogenase